MYSNTTHLGRLCTCTAHDASRVHSSKLNKLERTRELAYSNTRNLSTDPTCAGEMSVLTVSVAKKLAGVDDVVRIQRLNASNKSVGEVRDLRQVYTHPYVITCVLCMYV